MFFCPCNLDSIIHVTPRIIETMDITNAVPAIAVVMTYLLFSCVSFFCIASSAST